MGDLGNGIIASAVGREPAAVLCRVGFRIALEKKRNVIHILRIGTAGSCRKRRRRTL